MRKFYKVNHYIPYDQVRVIGADEGQVGVMTKAEALALAQKAGSDLVLVAETAKPPVVKIIDFNKFKYQQTQKEKGSKKKTKATDQKEIRFTPFIAQNDFDTRIERLKEFLELGHKVKLTVKFTGRQITRKDFGDKILNRAIAGLSEYGTQESPPKLQGKLLWTTMAPRKKDNDKNG